MRLTTRSSFTTPAQAFAAHPQEEPMFLLQGRGTMAFFHTLQCPVTMQAFPFFIAVTLLVSTTGCQQRTTSKLLGRWEGRPDSAALRADREAEKYGKKSSAEVSARREDPGSPTQTSLSPQVTDWENYQVLIQFDFVSSERLEMSLDGKQPRSGSWKIISTSPAGCTIEVQTEADSAESEVTKSEVTELGAVAGQDAGAQRRQFELLLDERDGTCVGFLLTEAGADRLQGAIYFQRPGGSSAVR